MIFDKMPKGENSANLSFLALTCEVVSFLQRFIRFKRISKLIQANIAMSLYRDNLH